MELGVLVFKGAEGAQSGGDQYVDRVLETAEEAGAGGVDRADVAALGAMDVGGGGVILGGGKLDGTGGLYV